MPLHTGQKTMNSLINPIESKTLSSRNTKSIKIMMGKSNQLSKWVEQNNNSNFRLFNNLQINRVKLHPLKNLFKIHQHFKNRQNQELNRSKPRNRVKNNNWKNLKS